MRLEGAIRRLPDALVVDVVPLAEHTAAQAMRWEGNQRVQVSDRVPACRVAALARHVIAAHVGRGGYCRVGSCLKAQQWLAPDLPTAVNA